MGYWLFWLRSGRSYTYPAGNSRYCYLAQGYPQGIIKMVFTVKSGLLT
jgi:hypothetical protein